MGMIIYQPQRAIWGSHGPRAVWCLTFWLWWILNETCSSIGSWHMVPCQRFCMGKIRNFYGVEPCCRKNIVGYVLWEFIASPHFWFFLCFLCATEMWSLSFLVLLPCLSCHYQLRNHILLSSSCFWFWCSITATERQTTTLQFYF